MQSSKSLTALKALPLIGALRVRSRIVASLQGRWPRQMAWLSLLSGVAMHLFRGVTPKPAHQALVTLFVLSGGRANDRLARLINLFHRPYRLPEPKGVLGNLTQGDLRRIQEQLGRDGYFVFENCLSGEFCDAVIKHSLELNYLIATDELAAKGEVQFGRFDRNAPRAPRYALSGDVAADIPEIQQLLSDPSLLAVAQNYLASKPIFTGLGMDWSAPVKARPDDQAAQTFHWDMERIRWLRFFVYLTDVTAESGPHCFIRGTHRTGAIPEDLRALGYVRHSDETIIQHFGAENYCEFVGNRGTIIAEDSRGFHKGKMPTKGDRLLLGFELSNTTFGANKRCAIRNIHVPRFGGFVKKYPRLYRNFDFVQSRDQ